LAFAYGGEQVHDARARVVWGGYELKLLYRIDGSQVVEQHLVSRGVGMFEVDRFHFKEGKIAFAFLWRPDLTGNRVARLQVEPPDLRGGNIDVVWPWEIVVIGRP